MPKRKNKPLIIVAIIVTVILVLLSVEILRGPRSVFAGFDRQEQRGYEQIATGTTKEQLLKILGQPIKSSDTFCLPQRHGFESFFDEAERSDAVDYLLWVNGMNWYYCIGFDSSGRFVMKGEGHS